MNNLQEIKWTGENSQEICKAITGMKLRPYEIKGGVWLRQMQSKDNRMVLAIPGRFGEVYLEVGDYAVQSIDRKWDRVDGAMFGEYALANSDYMKVEESILPDVAHKRIDEYNDSWVQANRALFKTSAGEFIDQARQRGHNARMEKNGERLYLISWHPDFSNGDLEL